MSHCRKTIVALLLFNGFSAIAFAQTKPLELKSKAENQYFDSVLKAQGEFRVQLAEAVAGADHAEIFLLDFQAADPEVFKRDENAKYIAVKPYKKITKILQSKELEPEELQQLLPELEQTIGVRENEYGAFCHYPIHGIRLYSEGSLLFETTFCWVCHNFYVDYLSFESGWVGIAPDSKLKALFTQLMPIPKAELDRFEQFQKPKKK